MENKEIMILEGMIALQENELEMLYEAVAASEWNKIDSKKIIEKIAVLDSKYPKLKPIKSESQLTDIEKGKLARAVRLKEWFRFFNTKDEIIAGVKTQLKGAAAGAAVGAAVGAAKGADKNDLTNKTIMGSNVGQQAANYKLAYDGFKAYAVKQTVGGRLIFSQHKKLNGTDSVTFVVVPYKNESGKIVIKKFTATKNMTK